MSPSLLKLLAGLAAAASLIAPSMVHAEGASVVRVDMGSGPSAQSLVLPEGRSAVVELPVDARDVLVSNPIVAQAVLRTPRRIFVVGGKPGATDAVFFDAAGRRILTLSIRVDQNTSSVQDTINRLLPDSHVHVEAINDSVILSGMAANASDADKALEIAKAATPAGAQVLNMMAIAGKDQVMLKVRIVEMQRSVIKQLGLNWQGVLNQAGNPTVVLGTAATFGINGTLLGGLTGALHETNAKGAETLQGDIQAFERVGLIRNLAEPNLTAVSGEAANFLVGGEFPVPTGQSDTGQVSIEFKPFGVGLGFTPIVLSGGRISLKLSTEVSEVSNQGAFSIPTGVGTPSLVIPSLTVRKSQTTVELPSGGSMMIAGLMQDTSNQDLDSIPGVGDIPILGALFRSRDFQSGQTELVIIVTPYIVTPGSPADMQTPIDGLQASDDASTILLGRLNETYKHAPEATTGRTYQGPYGYVVE